MNLNFKAMERNGSALLKRLRHNKSGLAFIEFALSLPIMVPLTVFGLEAANLGIANMRVSQTAMMVADNTARVRDRIDEADISNIMLGAKLAGDGINLLGRGRIIVATIEDNAATTGVTDDQVVTWQRCKGAYNPGTTLTAQGLILSGGVGNTGNKISPQPGDPVIFVEIFYQHQLLVPLMSQVIFGTPVLRYTAAFSVRDRGDQTMQNGSGLSGSALASCSLYNAT